MSRGAIVVFGADFNGHIGEEEVMKRCWVSKVLRRERRTDGGGFLQKKKKKKGMEMAVVNTG